MKKKLLLLVAGIALGAPFVAQVALAKDKPIVKENATAEARVLIVIPAQGLATADLKDKYTPGGMVIGEVSRTDAKKLEQKTYTGETRVAIAEEKTTAGKRYMMSEASVEAGKLQIRWGHSQDVFIAMGTGAGNYPIIHTARCTWSDQVALEGGLGALRIGSLGEIGGGSSNGKVTVASLTAALGSSDTKSTKTGTSVS